MACGKSFWGAQLAERLKLHFVDLDAVIAQRSGKSIPEIFAEHGEDFFRQLERQTLRETAHHAPCIVATGGGAPCFFDNMNWMNKQGVTVYLQTPTEVLAARLAPANSDRPLLQGISEKALLTHIENLMAIRAPFYLQAKHIANYQPDSIVFLENLLDLVRDDAADI